MEKKLIPNMIHDTYQILYQALQIKYKKCLSKQFEKSHRHVQIFYKVLCLNNFMPFYFICSHSMLYMYVKLQGECYCRFCVEHVVRIKVSIKDIKMTLRKNIYYLLLNILPTASLLMQQNNSPN